MSMLPQNTSLTDLIDLGSLAQELKEMVADLTISLRVLLANEEPVILGEQPAPLDDLINETPRGVEAARQCDEELLRRCQQSARTRGIIECSCHTGLVRYAIPIFLEDRCLGVVVSGGVRAEDFYDNVDELATRYELDPEHIRQVVQQVPPLSLKHRKSIVELVHALLNQLVSMSLQNIFTAEAMKQRDLESLLDFVVTHTPKLIWGVHCSVFLWDEDKDLFVLKRTSSDLLKEYEGSKGYAKGFGYTGWVGAYGQPLTLNHQSKMDKNNFVNVDGPAPQWSKGHMMEVAGTVWQGIIVPIFPAKDEEDGVDDDFKPIGVIRLAPQRKGLAPDKAHEALLRKIANLIGAAVQNDRRNQQLIDIVIETANTVEGDLRYLLNHISKVFQSFSSHIRIWNPDSDLWFFLEISDSHYRSAIELRGAKDTKKGRIMEEIQRNNLPYYCDSQAKVSGKILVDEDGAVITNDSAYADYKSRITDRLLVPFRGSISKHDKETNEQGIIGMLILHRKNGHNFTQRDIRLALRLSPAIGTVVAALRATAKLRGFEMALNGPEKIKIDYEALFNRGKLLEDLLKNALSAVDADLALVREFDNAANALRLVAYQFSQDSSFSDVAPPQLRSQGEGGSGLAYEERRPIFIPVVENDPIYATKFNEGHMTLLDGTDPMNKTASEVQRLKSEFEKRIRSEIAVPIQIAGKQRVLTVVKMSKAAEAQRFKLRDFHTMVAFAEKAALVLHCAYLIETGAVERLNAWKLLAAQAAHEIGNPVSHIAETLELFNITLQGDADAIESIRDAQDSVKDIRKFLRDFRQFATSKSLNYRHCDLSQIIRAALDKAPSFDEIDLKIDEQVPEVEIDDGRFKSCLLELIRNAHEAGATKLSIGASLVPDEGNIEITIKDNGQGTSDNEVSDIFEPLYTTKEQGTGLGLAIVHDIVQQHNGTIYAHENADQGLQFFIRIPVTRQLKESSDDGQSINRRKYREESENPQ